MIRKLKYFASVVQNNSFSEAAEECHISQSAISQQIQNLECELGVKLLARGNRSFSLTPAGEHFYRRGSILISDFEKLIKETAVIASGRNFNLRIGYLKSYAGAEFKKALKEFTSKYPDIEIEIMSGNHEELYELLRTEKVDVVFNDQRRAFSNEYTNRVLATLTAYIETSDSSFIADKAEVNAEELRAIPCILISSSEQRKNEEKYYREIYGIESKIIFAENFEEDRLMIIGNKGYLPIELGLRHETEPRAASYAPLCKNGHLIKRNYCLFWKKDNSGYYTEDFADILKAQFDSVNI